MNTQPTSAIERAVELADGVDKLAEACGVSVQAVYKWLKKGFPPTGRCEAIERAVGGKISRFDLLPPSFASRQTARKNSPHRSTDPLPEPSRSGRQPPDASKLMSAGVEHVAVLPKPRL